MFGGVKRVKTTVRPSGVNVDEKTSPVDTTPRAKSTAASPAFGKPATSSPDVLFARAHASVVPTSVAAISTMRCVEIGMTRHYSPADIRSMVRP
jgi:hypothetical protein